MADAEQVKDAAAAYVFGYPLVYDLKEVASFVEGGGSLPMQAPYNGFASARRLLGPETRFVSPNNDTLYVGGQCDVRQGPLVLHVPDFYLVANPIDRYSIGDRTPGLRTAEDGSVTISMQASAPGPDKESNWLPAPAGRFRPIMRMYEPRQPILDGTYVLPAVRKVG